MRLWALLFLPVNWSESPGWWLRVSAVLMLAVLVVLAFSMGGSCIAKSPLSVCLLFTLCGALPAFSLLLIGPDLAGARVLYLHSIGICLFLAELIAARKLSNTMISFCAAVLPFQLAALLHNESIWKEQAKLAYQACADAGSFLEQVPESRIYAVGLPKTRHGVFFLGNGFGDCVAVAGGGNLDASRVNIGSTPAVPSANDYTVTWDEESHRLTGLK